jgi:arginine deiminase
MSSYTTKAEYHQLESVRVHPPGFEVFAGIVDPEPNLFRSDFSIEAAQKQHEAVVSVLKEEGIDTHYLHEDLAGSDRLEALVDTINIDLDDVEEGRRERIRREIRSRLQSLSPNEKLQLVACNATVVRHGQKNTEQTRLDGRNIKKDRNDRTSLEFSEPLANLYFQRDQQIVTAKGPVIGSPAYSTREGELPIARAAWEEIGASIVCDVPSELQLEGGDYIPCGDFALLGVSAIVDGENKPLRTSTEAAEYLLERDVFDHDVIGLVNAPVKEDKQSHRDHGQQTETGMEIMHLDTWFNIAAEGIAVARKRLVEGTTVNLYVSDESGYTKQDELNFGDFLRSRGYSIVPVEYEERAIATNFLTLDDGKVFAPCFADENGEPDRSRNKTIGRMQDAGIEVVPNGEGLPIPALRSGYGGIHCMTTPLNRTS